MRRYSNYPIRSISIHLAILLVAGAKGQSSIASYNGLHAIVGARIEVGDGRTIEKGTVVIKDGLIVAVGAGATAPRGADVLDGKGLTVYPGFIDAYTTKGYTAPPASAGRSPASDPNGDIANYASAFMRETVRNGISPEIEAVHGLALSDDLLKSYQSSGFTTIMVAPSGGDISGMGSLVNLSGRSNRECVVLPEVGESFGFGGGGFGDGYPSSLLGHMAQIRQTLYDANWYGAVQRSFDAGGAKRPPSDESLRALQPVVTGRIPAVFDAESSAQIGRALNLSNEFSLKLLIAGGSEGWKKVEEIKKTGAAVLLSLPFGVEPGSSPEKPEAGPPKEGSTPEKPPEPEVPAKVAERKRLYQESVKNPSILVAAGVPVAWTTKGNASPSAFLENLRKAVKAGLPEEAALKALTIDAAKIFGVDRQMGTVEVGKTANLVVTTTGFMDPQMKVKMLYVDGRKIDPLGSKPPAAVKPPPVGEDGN